MLCMWLAVQSGLRISLTCQYWLNCLKGICHNLRLMAHNAFNMNLSRSSLHCHSTSSSSRMNHCWRPRSGKGNKILLLWLKYCEGLHMVTEGMHMLTSPCQNKESSQSQF